MGPHSGDEWTARQMGITQRLRRRRAELGLTQKQIVTRLGRAGVFTTNRAVSSLEHGAGLDVAKLPELAAALDCTVTYLVGLTANPHQWEPDEGVGKRPPAQRGSQEPAAAPAPHERVDDIALSAPSLILGIEIPDRAMRRSAAGS